MIRDRLARELRHLITDLHDTDPTRREAAVARLRVIGAPALPRLSALVKDASDARTRCAALRALEGMTEPAVADLALDAMQDGDEEVRLAAVVALRPWVLEEAGTRVMERLVTAALDVTEPARLRRAALDALAQLPPEIVGPLVERAAVAPTEPPADEPEAVHDWLAQAPDAPLSALHDLVSTVRDRETRETSPVRRQAWLAARGALHAALARRDSRVALYDLRETFISAAAPLPLDFLHAMTALGDATCLEPLAKAWVAAPAGETWWRSRLSETARAIIARHRLTARHPVVKRVRERWPGMLA